MEKKLSLKKVMVIGLFIAIPFFYLTSDLWYKVYLKMRGMKTVEEIVKEIGPKVDANLRKDFALRKVSYPPEKITFIAYKKDRVVELWAHDKDKVYLVKTYIVHKESGTEGPKLREGDNQVPEGIYIIKSLNPNSKFYLSLELNYPNEFDWRKAHLDGRDKPGSDIFIHGKAWSVGCLAMGDEQIEEIFFLTAKAGRENVKVIISPNREVKSTRDDVPRWTPELYNMIRDELKIYKQ